MDDLVNTEPFGLAHQREIRVVRECEFDAERAQQLFELHGAVQFELRKPEIDGVPHLNSIEPAMERSRRDEARVALRRLRGERRQKLLHFPMGRHGHQHAGVVSVRKRQ